MIDVFIEADRLVATSNSQFLGKVPIQSHTFLHFRGTGPELEGRHWVQITRVGTGVSRALRVVSYTLIVAIALMGLAIPLYHQWRLRTGSNTHAAPSAADMQAWQAERTQLLLAIAQLDNDQANGALAETVYRQRRQSYKQQLRRVAEALHQARHPFDAASVATHSDVTHPGTIHKELP
jgi:hypothetical protein